MTELSNKELDMLSQKLNKFSDRVCKVVNKLAIVNFKNDGHLVLLCVNTIAVKLQAQCEAMAEEILGDSDMSKYNSLFEEAKEISKKRMQSIIEEDKKENESKK